MKDLHAMPECLQNDSKSLPIFPHFPNEAGDVCSRTKFSNEMSSNEALDPKLHIDYSNEEQNSSLEESAQNNETSFITHDLLVTGLYNNDERKNINVTKCFNILDFL